MKKTAVLIAVIAILGIFGFIIKQFAGNDNEFYSLLAKSTGTLDLREIKKDKAWDELLIVRPMDKACFPDGQCVESKSDSELYLVFSKGNSFADAVKVNRAKMDFAASVPNRVPKISAQFTLLKQEGVPTYQLATP